MIKYVYLHHWSIIVCHYSLDTYFPLSLSPSLSPSLFVQSVSFSGCSHSACACAPVDFFSCFYALLVFPFRNIIGGAMHLSSPLAQPPPSPLPLPSDHFLYSNFSLSLSLSFSPAYPMISDFHVFRRVPHLPEIRGARSVERSEPRVNGKLDCPQRCLDSLSMLRVPLLVFHVFHSRFRSFFFSLDSI